MTPTVTLADVVGRIQPLNPAAGVKAQAALDQKTKPRRSLGRLEDIAVWLAQVSGDPKPTIPKKVIVVAAADHGVAAAGVSAYPSDVTAQMVMNFVSGGAAINVLARQANADLVVVDVGVKTPVVASELLERRIRAGTANMLDEPAMSLDQALATIGNGVDLADDLLRKGYKCIGLGEMGIGNTTAASALVACLLKLPVADVTGRGTGLDDAGLRRKIDTIETAIARRQPQPDDPLDVLAKVGGLEIGFLAGVCLGAAANRQAVILDGFITGAAALIACQLVPSLREYLLASHVSVERGHRYVLAHLGLKPLLDFDLRLGEGTGAALAMPIVDAALHVLHDMATFGDAGVSDTGR